MKCSRSLLLAETSFLYYCRIRLIRLDRILHDPNIQTNLVQLGDMSPIQPYSNISQLPWFTPVGLRMLAVPYTTIGIDKRILKDQGHLLIRGPLHRYGAPGADPESGPLNSATSYWTILGSSKAIHGHPNRSATVSLVVSNRWIFEYKWDLFHNRKAKIALASCLNVVGFFWNQLKMGERNVYCWL